MPGQLAPLLDLMGVGRPRRDRRRRPLAQRRARRRRARPPARGRARGRGPAAARRDAATAGASAPSPPPGGSGPSSPPPRLQRIGLRDRRHRPRAAARAADGRRRRRPRRSPALAALRRARTGPPARLRGRPQPRAIRQAARGGGPIVITDTNRRRAFVAARLRANTRRDAAARPGVSRGRHDARPVHDGRDRTPTRRPSRSLRGVKTLSAPFSPQVTQFPEHRPFAALDGDPRPRGSPTARSTATATTSTSRSTARATSRSSTSSRTPTAAPS